MSLLQPAPEVFNLFDDVCLLSEGRIVFMGPKEEVPPIVPRLAITCSRIPAHATPLASIACRMHEGFCAPGSSLPLVSYHFLCLCPFAPCSKCNAWSLARTSQHASFFCLSPLRNPRVMQVLPFFESMGFRLPQRKGIADFLQGSSLQLLFQSCSSQLCLSVAPTCSRRNHHHPIGLPVHDVIRSFLSSF